MAGSPNRDGNDPGAAAEHGVPDGRQQDPSLDRVIQAQIGDKLRAMYGELVEQPVPDRLTAILDRLSTGKARDR